MPRAWKNVKRYERWVLIGVVIILLATFSVTGATRQGCAAGGGHAQNDHGGSFEVAPGKRESVSDEDFYSVFMRYHVIYEQPGWGPSLRWADEMQQSRRGNGELGTFMHMVLVKAAEAAGYMVGDEELLEGVHDMVTRIFGGGRSGSRSDFSPEKYDQVVGWIAERTGMRAGHRFTRAEFEQTVREILLKDKFLSDVIALGRHRSDRADAFEDWKPMQQRVDLAFAAVPSAQFAAAVELEEATRTVVGAQLIALKKLALSGHHLRTFTDELKKWETAKKALPADEADLLKNAPPEAPGFGKEMPKDPWGKPYAYEKAGDVGRITSAGPDGKPGTTDDVTLAVADLLDATSLVWQVGDAIVRWQTTSGAWPSSLADLTKPPTPPEGKPAVPAPLQKVPQDPWKHDLAWDLATKTLRTNGPDGTGGNADDIAVTISDPGAKEGFRVPWPSVLGAYVFQTSIDAWKHPLRLLVKLSPLAFDVTSTGPDGVAGNEDDVRDGNESDLASYYGETAVKSQFGLPMRREFEVLYVVPALVSDEKFAEAWKKFPEFQPTEQQAWDAFRQGEASVYRVEEAAADAPGEPPPEPPPDGAMAPGEPPPKKEPERPAPKKIAPGDPEKGYAAALLKTLREGTIPKDAKGWQVPAAADFGDRAEYKPAPGMPNAASSPHFKTYLDDGWRLVALRDLFFDKMLDSMLKKSRDAKDAHEKHVKSQTATDTPLISFQEQLAKLQEFQPGNADLATGARFMDHFTTTPEKPLSHDDWEKLPVIGGIQLSLAFSSITKDDDYAVLPNPLGAGDVRSAVHMIARHNAKEQPLEAVREQVWPKYVKQRSVERAARELERVRDALTKPPSAPAPVPPGVPATPGAPAEPPAAPAAPSKPDSKPDGEARAKELVAAIEKLGKERGFTFTTGRTGPFIAETVRAERDATPREGASDDEKAAVARRSFVRRNGYDTVSRTDAQGTQSVEPGTVGRRALRDVKKRDDDHATDEAYLVVVAVQEDPAPEEFTGKEYLSWVSRHAYDDVPAGQPSAGSLADRKGFLLQLLYRLYDDWDAIRQDYKVETNSDFLMPRGAGRAH